MLIVCDESQQGNCKVIGGISISLDQAIDFEKEAFRNRYNNMVFGEICWKHLHARGKYLDFYLDLIKLFFSYSTARFHSNSFKQNQYTAGYVLVRSISWKIQHLYPNDELDILFDSTGEIGKKEVEVTRSKLDTAYSDKSASGFHKVYHKVRMCNQTDSHVINLGQIADLLVGSVAYKIAVKEKALPHNEVKDYFISEIEKIDGGLDISFSIKGVTWGYNQKKIQHYNLHLY